MKLACVVMTFACVACGGKIDGDDGGSPPNDASTGNDAPIIIGQDAQLKPDVVSPPAQCANYNVDGEIGSNGSCSISASWQCGTTSYAVKCTCPSATCECDEQTTSSGSGTTVQAPSICNGQCSPTVPELGAVCGFPTN